MRKIVAAINMSLDGFCDHTAMVADDQLHQHYTDLLTNAGAIIYGRITYQLMESYWPTVVQKPTGVKPTDDFAVAIETIPKIVFSRTLRNVGWKNARLAKADPKAEALALKQQPGSDILVGSRSMITALMKLNLIDEYQLCVHPVVAGSGLPLFENIKDRAVFKLSKTKCFGSGAIVLYYQPTSQ
jgi:dihydrofolate reductase